MAGKDLDLDNLNENKSSTKRTIIIVTLVILLAVAAAVAGTLYFFGINPLAGSNSAQAEEQTAIKPSDALYVELEPPFVVNLTREGRRRFMQVYVTVKVHSPEAKKAVQKHRPLLRSDLNVLFAKQSFRELQTVEGKKSLRQQTTQAVQKVMEQAEGVTIDKVLFTDFVMQ